MGATGISAAPPGSNAVSSRSNGEIRDSAAGRARRGATIIKADVRGRRLYEPDGAVLTRYVMSNNRVDIVEGPIGSGKTNAMFRRLGRHAMQQEPSPRDGLRRTRWAIIRNTFPELKRTTIPTWRRVWPANLYGEGKMGSPPRHEIAFGYVRIEVDFLAFEDENHIQKLHSPTSTTPALHELHSTELPSFHN